MTKGKLTPQQVQRLLAKELEPAELPLVPEFFDFAYSDEGLNDPLNVLLHREENDEFTLEVITVGTHTIVHFNYHKDTSA